MKILITRRKDNYWYLYPAIRIEKMKGLFDIDLLFLNHRATIRFENRMRMQRHCAVCLVNKD